MAALIRPMLATLGPLPGADVEERWAFEMKWDGARAMVYVARGAVTVYTRNDREVVATYPELRGLGELDELDGAVLDGEIVALDGRGRPSFGQLQARMHVQRPTTALLAATPVSLLLFDVCRVSGESLLKAPYDDRRAVLEELAVDGAHWATPPAFAGDGASALAASDHQGLEGVVAKQRTSVYEAGRRSRSWVKVKHVRMQEVVVVGWSPGEGNRSGRIGSLLLGVPDESGELVFAGHVGTGFTVRVLDDLLTKLRPLARRTPPVAGDVPAAQARVAHWVTPKLVGEVAYGEWTRTGRLRHPVWRGLRSDKTPADVRREDG